MGGSKHKDKVRDRIGVYYKYKSKDYRKECKSCDRGYHSHRWEAHHILPGVVFNDLQYFIKECLGVTPYNINKPYSIAGLPTLKAFILYFQSDPTFPINKKEEKLVEMKRWGKIKKHKYMKDIEVKYPGDFPCHNPVSFGHVIYNENVDKDLQKKIWDSLQKKKKMNEHFKPENVYEKLTKVKDDFWEDLKERGEGKGGGNNKGVESNFRNRYSSARNGWWKPMCMADINEAPISSEFK